MNSTILLKGQPYDDMTEMCRIWQISRYTIRRWRQRGLLPEPIRIGRVKFYDRAEVEQMLKNGE